MHKSCLPANQSTATTADTITTTTATATTTSTANITTVAGWRTGIRRAQHTKRSVV
jgi:hypothetical protein